MISDLFCAFQPKREMVPSLPLRLGRPLMPSADFVDGLALERLMRIVVSGDLLDQPRAEHRRRDAEDHVAVGELASRSRAARARSRARRRGR